jgi:cell division protein FtsB
LKTKKAGLLTKIVVLALLIYLSITLLDLRSQIRTAEAERDARQQEVNAQVQTNAALSTMLENSDDPDALEDLARDKLGLVKPGEKVFYDIGD